MELSEGMQKTELGPVPEDWTVGTFGEFMDGFSSGMTPYRGNKEYYKGDFPWITSGELNYNVITDTNEKITEDAIRKTNLKIIPPGTFLMAVTGMEAEGTRGSCAITGIPATTNQSCMALYPKKGVLETGYLYHYYILYGKDLALKYSQGTKQQSYNAVTAKRLPIVFPRYMDEQKVIVQVLTDIDIWIHHLGNLIRKKRGIKQATMEKLLTPKTGWESKTLAEIGTITMGQSPLSKYYNQFQQGLPLIQGNADVKNRKTIIRNYTSVYTKVAEPNDIIMSVRAPVGEIAKTSFRCCLGRGVCAISYPNDFLYYLLIFRERAWEQLSSGTTFDSINSDQVKKFQINLPKSHDEQEEIADIISNIDSELTMLEKQLDKARNIKIGTMQKLLTGKIRLDSESVKIHSNYL